MHGFIRRANTGMRTALLAGAVFLGLVASGTASASGPSNAGDFGQLAKNGFAYAVDGAFYLDPGKTEYPNLQPTGLGGPLNTYSWSMAWFQNALWVGTNRDVTSADRVAAGPAEIWRYTPSTGDASGDWGLSGTWQQVYVSPSVSRIVAWLSGGAIPTDYPRDAGYRNMTVCNAGGNGTTSRLYVTATGLPPSILYWNGSSFSSTSTSGFPTTLANVSDISTADLGFRGLVCFKGRLFASPAGTAADVDISNHPILLMNTNPAGGAAWQTVLDVKNGGYGLPGGTADPNNIGIFQIAAMGNYLWVAVINRTTGFQLWRGDGTACQLPWVSSTCNISWSKVITNGGGRPNDLPLVTPVIDNAGATVGVFGHDLYIAPSESGFYGATLAEMFRVPNADSVPAGGPSAPHKWQLIVGWPRRDYAKPGERLPGLENLDCTNVGDVPNTKAELSPVVQSVWDNITQLIQAYTGVPGVDPVGLDNDSEDDDCLPSSNAGPGLPVGILKDPMSLGNESYFWRFAEHQGELFVGTLDIASGSGFDLLKTADGINFNLVADQGLGNPNAYGVRSLVSTPLGLFLGTANATTTLPNGGTDVYLGTTAPAGQTAPKANAGADQFQFDTDQNNSESFTLSASSMDAFGGTGLAPSPYEWFSGAQANNCISLQSADAISTAASLPVVVASNSPDPDVNSYTYTLRVTNLAGQVGCDEVTVTASHHLPPQVDPWYSGANPMLFTSVPATYNTGNSDGSAPTVNLIDFGGAGSQSYDVTAFCTDPDKELVGCEFQSLNTPGVTLSNVHDTAQTGAGLVSCTNQAVCQISARLSVPDWQTLPASNSGSALRPDVQVLATDTRGNQTTRRWESLAQAIVDTPAQNDKPVCRNADLVMIIGQDTHVTFNPATVSPPICVDPDGDAMTYASVTTGSFPLHGTVAIGANTITYTPTNASAPMVDYFTFRASDPGGLNTNDTPSRDPIIRVTLRQDTSSHPGVAVSFPASGTSYSAAGYLAGCSSPGGDVCGTATDDLSSITSVQVAIRDSSGRFWNGSAFVANAGTPLWHTATGTSAWSYAFTPPASGSYTLLTKSVDQGGNESGVLETPFDQQGDSIPPTVTIGFPSAGGGYTPASYLAGCSSPGGDICGTAADSGSGVNLVKVAVRDAGGNFWNGAAFVANGGTPLWQTATGQTAWSYAFTPPSNGSYTVLAQSFDVASNPSTIAQAAFSQQTDNVPPTVSISFPASGGSYTSSAFNRGCSTTTADICGSASDAASGVASVQISLRRTSDNTWWNGSAFVAGSQIWVPATGTTGWSYAFTPAASTSYSLQARATDGAGNSATTAARSFSRRFF